MLRSAATLAVLSGLAYLAPSPLSSAEPSRHATAVQRYGLEGHIQSIGLHHGFHILRVAPDSPAEADRLEAHDVIVKVDGEIIRNLQHLQTLLTDADEDDGNVILTILKHGSLEHHVVNGHLRGRDGARTARETQDRKREGQERR
jgi:S1-C subfamily serine protease